MKYKAIFLRKEADRFVLVKTKTFNPHDKTVKYDKGKAVQVFLKHIAYYDEKTALIFYDYDTGNVLSFKESEVLMTPEEIDILCLDNAMVGLVQRIRNQLAETDKGKIVTTIIIFIVGGIIGYLIHGAI